MSTIVSLELFAYSHYIAYRNITKNSIKSCELSKLETLFILLVRKHHSRYAMTFSPRIADSYANLSSCQHEHATCLCIKLEASQTNCAELQIINVLIPYIQYKHDNTTQQMCPQKPSVKWHLNVLSWEQWLGWLALLDLCSFLQASFIIRLMFTVSQ